MKLTVWLLGIELFAVELGQPNETEETVRVDDLGSTRVEVGFKAPMVEFIPADNERGYE